ncbi:hypothetical protein KY347_04435 [Candidatus Woesearchaeota archaeon]|nr:hypothetical protein [Candidatus Woesearchaeota archaeon]
MSEDGDKMGLLEWSNKNITKFNAWDIACIKVYCLLVGIVVGAYIAGFVKAYVWFFIAVIVLLVAKLLYKMLK